MTPNRRYRATLRALPLAALCVAALVATGCATAAPLPTHIPTPPAECASVAILLSTPTRDVRAGEMIEVTIAPEGCVTTSQWAGQIVVRTATADLATGARLDDGETTTSVVIPPEARGDALVMLVPDEDCGDVFDAADCHYPYVSVTISP